MPSRKKMAIIISVVVIVFAAALFIWWALFFGRANPPLPQASVTVQPSSTVPGADQVAIDGATFNVEIASTTLEQARGLSYRASLGANDGMLFIFPRGGVQSFWMKDMNFPLDMIWISGTTVAGIAENVPAPASDAQLWELQTYSSPANTDKVLEVNAGTAAKYGIKPGDTVSIGPISGTEAAGADYRNATYIIEGTPVALVNGTAAVPAAPGSASMVVTQYFGNEATGDLNGDGRPDVAFIITQSGGGSGTFYYMVAALADASGGYKGTNAVLLGDRIAPQATSIEGGEIVANYADRAAGEPMTARPSVGVSKRLKVQNGTLVEVSQ